MGIEHVMDLGKQLAQHFAKHIGKCESNENQTVEVDITDAEMLMINTIHDEPVILPLWQTAYNYYTSHTTRYQEHLYQDLKNGTLKPLEPLPIRITPRKH